MIAVLSPAKSLDFDSPTPIVSNESPALLAESERLIQQAKMLKSTDIQSLMSVSEKIAELNTQRFKDFNTPFTPENAKPAIFAFTGDVYSGFDALTLDENGIEFAQSHLRILSGLYGLMCPMDLMQAYRLEMGLKFCVDGHENLYQFWGERITEVLNESLRIQDDNTLINLASNEYFKSIKPKNLLGNVINIDFKENRDGKWKIVSFSAKKARGIMARYMVDNRIDRPEGLRDFDCEGYGLNEKISTSDHWVFTREQPEKV